VHQRPLGLRPPVPVGRHVDDPHRVAFPPVPGGPDPDRQAKYLRPFVHTPTKAHPAPSQARARRYEPATRDPHATEPGCAIPCANRRATEPGHAISLTAPGTSVVFAHEMTTFQGE
jgi:hypothetical protein